MLRTLNSCALLVVALVLCACPSTERSTSRIGTAGKAPAGADYGGPFQLEAHSLAESQLLGPGQVLTTEYNSLAGIDLAAEEGQVCKLQFKPRGIEAIMNIPLRQDGRKRTVMFFPDRRIMTTVAAADGQPMQVLVIDTETGMELDVTPSNLPALWDGEGDMPLVAWTGKHGLCIHVAGQRADEIVIWAGHNTLTEVQRIPATIAIGRRLSDEGLQFLAVNSALELLVYDETSGSMIPDMDETSLAAAIANVSGQQQSAPVYFAAARGMAVMQTKDGSHWAIVGSDDQEDYLEVHDASGVTPDGRRRVPGPGDLLGGSEAQRLRREGAQQPAWVINEGFCLPVNDSHVGIFDLVYQRLVVIGIGEADAA